MPNFPEVEKNIIDFWKKSRVFEKSIEARPKARQFVFYEGPPTANGKPGLHHVLARIFKDIICRYKTMRGYRVERKAGWDTHGLPVELQVEKALGLKNKKDIEDYGIAEFNRKCQESVWQYKKDWEDLTERIGYWLDIKSPYITYEPEYIETVWWIIKQIWQKGLLYQDYKVVPYCSRCGTSLSSHEVAQGYKKIAETAIFLKLKVAVKSSKLSETYNIGDSTYLLVWTTTPWTLPGNVALAVHPDLTYVLVKVAEEQFILAKKRLEILDNDYKVIKEFKGRDLVGWGYEPIFDVKTLQTERAHRVYAADFVTDDEGTGIVHTATMYGVDDFELGKKYRLPQEHTVDKEGKFKLKTTTQNSKLFNELDGKFVKDGEPLIINNLKERGLLFKTELYEHDYPFCWRCKEPLLYYANEAWFIKMTAVKKQLLANNQKINWVPGHLKEGRFGEWLKEVKDWALSRERYWGTPLPVWRCQTGKSQKSKLHTPPPPSRPSVGPLVKSQKSKVKSKKDCDNIRVIGSLEELEKLSSKKIKDLHRPYIDEITFECDKCGGVMKRTSEVIDCWFDSGSMPFGQAHWPFAWPQVKSEKLKVKSYIEKGFSFPADYICEAIDQTRGWFYTLLAISTLLGFGPAYKNVISLGHLLDEKGEKMSKSKGNVIDPWLVLNKYGADAVRWFFFTVNQAGDSKQVRLSDIETCLKKFIFTFWNCFSFFETYVSKKEFSISNFQFSKNFQFPIFKHILDKWIISKLQGLILEATKKLDNYDITGAARSIENFVVDDLSLWYVRRSRRRFQHPQTEKDLKDASAVLGYVLLIVSKLTAPFVPFLSEEIYQKVSGFPEAEQARCGAGRFQVSGKNSVHLEDWPNTDKRAIDRALDEAMETTREIVALALAERAKKKVKVRQPLKKLKVKSSKLKVKQELSELIKEEVNIKEVVFDDKIEREVELDTQITPELEEEGTIREILRHIQEMRKEAGFAPKDKIMVRCWGLAQWQDFLEKHKRFFLDEGRIEDLAYSQQKPNILFDREKETKVGDEKLWLGIKKD